MTFVSVAGAPWGPSEFHVGAFEVGTAAVVSQLVSRAEAFGVTDASGLRGVVQRLAACREDWVAMLEVSRADVAGMAASLHDDGGRSGPPAL